MALGFSVIAFPSKGLAPTPRPVTLSHLEAHEEPHSCWQNAQRPGLGSPSPGFAAGFRVLSKVDASPRLSHLIGSTQAPKTPGGSAEVGSSHEAFSVLGLSAVPPKIHKDGTSAHCTPPPSLPQLETPLCLVAALRFARERGAH